MEDFKKQESTVDSTELTGEQLDKVSGGMFGLEGWAQTGAQSSPDGIDGIVGESEDGKGTGWIEVL